MSKELILLSKYNKGYSLFGSIHNIGGFPTVFTGDSVLESKHAINKDIGLSIRGDLYESYLKGASVNTEDFSKELPEPIRPDGDLIFVGEISGQIIKRLLNAVSKDKSKFTLNGIGVSKNHLVSIDGRQLYAYQYTDSSELINDKTIITRMSDLRTIASYYYKQSSIIFKVYKNCTVFETEDYRFTTNNLEGRFPNFKMFIPNKYEFTLRFDNLTLIKAIDLVKNSIDKESNKLVFKNIDGVLYILAKNEDSALMSSVYSTGNNHDFFCLNYKMLIEILKNSDIQEFNFNKNIAPFKIVSNDTRETIILMPMKLLGDDTGNDLEQFEIYFDNLTKNPIHTEMTLSKKAQVKIEKETKIIKKALLETQSSICLRCGDDHSGSCNDNELKELRSDLRWALAVIGELIPDLNKVKSINERISTIKNKL